METTKKYICQCCNYETKIKAQYNRHISTKKHDKLYEEQEKTDEMKEQLKEEYEIKMEELKEEYENKLLDKKELIKDLETQITELKADLIICERNRDKYQEKYDQVNKEVAERVAFITQDVKEQVHVMKDKMHTMELERQAETMKTNERLKEFNRVMKENEKEHELTIERMKMKHENELLKAMLNNKQEIIDLSFNNIMKQPIQPIQPIQQQPIQQQPIYITAPPIQQQPTQPKTKPKPLEPYDFVDTHIELDQLSSKWWDEEYTEKEILENAHTENEVGPKMYLDYIKGKNYQDCIMDVLLKEIKKESFYYKTEKDKQSNIFNIYYKDEWLLPEQSNKLLDEVILKTVRCINSFQVHRDYIIGKFDEEHKKDNPDKGGTRPDYLHTSVYLNHKKYRDAEEERMTTEYYDYSFKDNYLYKIKTRVLNNVLN